MNGARENKALRESNPNFEGTRLDDSAGVILAGGRSRRMGGGTKALLPLAGRPMLHYVIDRLGPQVDDVFLGVETAKGALNGFGLEQVPDPAPGSNGPLGGLAAALEHAACSGRKWLLLAPCDAPFLPRDLAQRLHGHAVAEKTHIAVAKDDSGLQPAFSLWRTGLGPSVQRAVSEQGMAGFRQFLRGQRYAVVEWPAVRGNPFFNINDREALALAQLRIEEGQEP